MGLAERFLAARRRAELSWPVGPGTVEPFERAFGHGDIRYTPPEYDTYLATSDDVYAAASLRARLMSSLTLKTFAGRDSSKREISAGPAPDLLRRVNPFWTAARLARMDELSMSIWGQSFWAVEKDSAGVPQEIWWVKASRMHPVPHEEKYLAGFLYEPLRGGPWIPFAADEVVWFRYPNPDDEFSPLSPLAAARLAADTSSAMLQSNRNLFRDGMQMGGVVVPDSSAGKQRITFSGEQAAALEEMLDKRFKGVSKSHRWAVMRFEAKFQAMAITPKDAEFVNGMNITLRRVCNSYGIPSPLLNDLEHATLANTVEYQKMLWSHALKPDSMLRAGEIEEQFLPMFGRRPGRATPDHCEFDYSQVEALQEAASESWGRERQAIEVGALTVNEWRQSKGMPPVQWGDVWWAPVNKSAVRGPDSQPQGDTAPANPQDVQQASEALAALDLAHMELRHGPLSLNGHGLQRLNGHRTEI